jgi:hypothetical protein
MTPLCPSCTTQHVHRGAGRAFVDGLREQSIKQWLLLGGSIMVNEALKQTLKLEVIKLAVRSPCQALENV